MMLFSEKIEERCIAVAAVITGIALLISFLSGRGASFGGVFFVGASSYFAVRSIVYLWFLLTRKIKRTDAEAKGHGCGLFAIHVIGALFIPFLVWKSILIIVPVQKDSIWSMAIAFICLCVYLFGGIRVINWLSPDE